MYAGMARYSRKRVAMIEWSYHPVLLEDYYKPATAVVSKFPLTAHQLDSMPCEDAFELVCDFNRRVRDRLGVAGVVPSGQDCWRPFANLPPLA